MILGRVPWKRSTKLAYGLLDRAEVRSLRDFGLMSNRLQLSVIARHCIRATCTPLRRVDSAGILPVKFTGVLHRVDGELEAYPGIINRF